MDVDAASAATSAAMSAAVEDPVLRAAVKVGLQLSRLVEQAEQVFIKAPEAERDIHRAYVVAYIVARDTWAQYLSALAQELTGEDSLELEVEDQCRRD